MKKLILATAIGLSSVLSLNACAVSSGQSSVGQYVDDATITTRVKAKFAEDAQVSAMRINVETLKGEVQLAGFAASEKEKARAAELALGVPDVK
ncbi:MAG: BON domain-containing protein, partial [Acidobacteriota bacterium]